MSLLTEHTPLLGSFVWFLLGAISYRLIRMGTGYRELQRYVDDVNSLSLRMVLRALEERLFVNKMKYKLLESNDFPKDVIDSIKENDAAEFDNWKIQVLGTFHTSYPRSYLGTIDFEAWQERFVGPGGPKINS